MKEIVAVMIGTTITNRIRDINEAFSKGEEIRMIERRHMEFMAALDLGRKWQELAEAPTLWFSDDEGFIYPATEPPSA